MIKYGPEEIKTINQFEEITGATVKDCIVNEKEATILVKPEDLGLAIGKNGSMIKKVKNKLGKKIHVYKYSENLEEFIKNLFYPVEPEEVKEKDGEVKVKVEPTDKKRTIGREGKKVKKVKELTQRHFDIENIKIL